MKEILGKRTSAMVGFWMTNGFHHALSLLSFGVLINLSPHFRGNGCCTSSNTCNTHAHTQINKHSYISFAFTHVTVNIIVIQLIGSDTRSKGFDVFLMIRCLAHTVGCLEDSVKVSCNPESVISLS